MSPYREGGQVPQKTTEIDDLKVILDALKTYGRRRERERRARIEAALERLWIRSSMQ